LWSRRVSNHFSVCVGIYRAALESHTSDIGGAGANVLRGVAAAGTLSLYDKYACNSSAAYFYADSDGIAMTGSRSWRGAKFIQRDQVKPRSRYTL
jgi:hypothetical protein